MIHKKRPTKAETRLLNAEQYTCVFDKTDRKFGNKHLLLLAHSTTLPYPRLGLIAAKKKIPLAVNRNRFKRLAREYFKANFELLTSIDVVILARADISKLTKEEQHKTFSHAFSKFIKQ